MTTLETLFHQAVALAGSARQRFLADVERDRPELLAELRALLSADQDPPSVLDRLDRKPRPRADDLIGIRVGDYRIADLLGEGGMCDVYLAERIDDRFEMAVAVKVLKAEIDDPVSRQRFAIECRILAALEHPSIARLLDAGALEDGRPFVVMERIEGEPIDVYCDRRRLDIEARLALFAKVCAAVDHAHRHLIVHRDLKPANILVTAEGEPRLLDFGIAKLLDPSASSWSRKGAMNTRQQPMTPQFASPEQVRGEPVSTASDTFALGLVLYGLLSGRRPYRFEALTPAEILTFENLLRAIRPPSDVISGLGRGDTELDAELEVGADNGETIARRRGTTVGQLERRLRGDLDAIVLKALRADPKDRYASADQLAADLGRHLDHRPVRAREGALRYLTSRFIRRHRLAFAVAAALAISMTSVIGAFAWQSVLIARERDRARLTSSLFFDLFEIYNPDRATGTETVRELLDRGGQWVTEADAPFTDDERATLLATLGALYDKIGDPHAALPHSEESLTLRRSIFGPRHPDVAASEIQTGSQRFAIGESEPGLALIARGVESLRSKLPRDDPRLGGGLRAYGLRLWDHGEHRRAEDTLLEALESLRKAPRARVFRDYIDTLTSLGALNRFLGRLEEAESRLVEAVEQSRQWFGPMHPATALSLASLSEIQGDQGRFAVARAAAEEAVEIMRTFRETAHPDFDLVLSNLCRRLEEVGDFARASTHRRELLEAKIANADSPADIATAHNNLAADLRRIGELEAADDHYRRALAIRLEVLEPNHPYVSQSYMSLGLLAHQRGRPEDALPELEHAVATLAASGMPDDAPPHAFIASAMARTLVDLGRASEAEIHARQALTIVGKSFGETHWRRAEAEIALGGSFAAQGRVDEAAPLLARGIDLLETLGDSRAFEISWARRWQDAATRP